MRQWCWIRQLFGCAFMTSTQMRSALSSNAIAIHLREPAQHHSLSGQMG
jgi:hypothetical protein